MRKNKCINCWTSFPRNQEMLLWGIVGLVGSLMFTGIAVMGML
ncbi:MAG: hypothetical protein ACX94C_02150 [Phycisphaerales bacterium]